MLRKCLILKWRTHQELKLMRRFFRGLEVVGRESEMCILGLILLVDLHVAFEA